MFLDSANIKYKENYNPTIKEYRNGLVAMFNDGAIDVNLNSIETFFLGITNKIKELLPTSFYTNKPFYRAIPKSIYAIEELLQNDLFVGYITAGHEGVYYILFPLLDKYFNSKEISKSDKERKLAELFLNYKDAERITNQFLTPEDRKRAETGLIYFKDHVNEIIRPYKIKFK